MQQRDHRWAWLAVTAVFLAGTALRVFILTDPIGTADSDEAVSGLLSRHFLADPKSFPVFQWGTTYAGTLEALLTAVPFAFFGSSTLALKLTIVALHGAACALLWRVGRRLIDERAGIVAGCALWLWPGLFVWWSTKARNYEVLLVCGLAALLFALRLAEDPKKKRDWWAFGAAVGVGWWTNPQVAFLAVPAGLWLLMGNHRALRHAAHAVPGLLVGAAPWLVWNLRHGWRSLDTHYRSTESYLGHLQRFWEEGIPVMLGLRTPYELRFAVPHWYATFLVLALAAGVSLVVVRRPGAGQLAVALLAYPMVHALLPVAGYTGEARYLYLYAPIVVLVVARAVRHPAAIAAAFAVMAASTVGALGDVEPWMAGVESDRAVPARMGPLIRVLEAEAIDAVLADYWIAYRLTFESRERIIAAGVPTNRHPPFEAYVRASPRSAWVFVEGSRADRGFRAGLADLGVAYRTVRAGGFAVHVPDRPVLPEMVLCRITECPAGAGS